MVRERCSVARSVLAEDATRGLVATVGPDTMETQALSPASGPPRLGRPDPETCGRSHERISSAARGNERQKCVCVCGATSANLPHTRWMMPEDENQKIFEFAVPAFSGTPTETQSTVCDVAPDLADVVHVRTFLELYHNQGVLGCLRLRGEVPQSCVWSGVRVGGC